MDQRSSFLRVNCVAAACGESSPSKPVSQSQWCWRDPVISRQARRLAYTSRLQDTNVWRVEVSGPGGEASPPVRLISSTHLDAVAQFSADGKRIAFMSNRSGSAEIWVCESDGYAV